MVLADFVNRHAGETAWLFGKGPSLSTFNFRTAGPLRVAINDVAAHVPDCLYCFANDGVQRWRDVYRPGQVLFQPARCLHEYDSRLPDAVACEVCIFEDQADDRRMALSRHQLAESLTIRRGTLGSALQILYIMGIETIHMVGIDGGGTHAPGYDWRTRLRHDHAKDYNAIRSAAIDAAAIMPITLKFHNQDHTMDTNGRIFVRMLKTCFVKGEPYSAYEIASFAPATANELFGLNLAEPYDPPAKNAPVKPPVETAESKVIAASENTTVATKKGRGKK